MNLCKDDRENFEFFYDKNLLNQLQYLAHHSLTTTFNYTLSLTHDFACALFMVHAINQGQVQGKMITKQGLKYGISIINCLDLCLIFRGMLLYEILADKIEMHFEFISRESMCLQLDFPMETPLWDCKTNHCLSSSYH